MAKGHSNEAPPEKMTLKDMGVAKIKAACEWPFPTNLEASTRHPHHPPDTTVTHVRVDG